jgi:hypothetical protein
MADLTITATAVAPVSILERITAPAAEAINAGQAVRFDVSSGKLTKANGSSAAEARMSGLALQSVAAGETLTALRKGLVDVGNALSALAYDADVYLSDTDGTLADAHGTVTLIAATVVPGWGYTTADKLLRLDL